MAKLSRKKGITSQIFHVVIKDSASLTGAGKTGLAYNTASLVCRYINASGTLSASITLEDITTLGTYQAPTSNAHIRFKEVSNADPTKGAYELHVHNDWMNLAGGNLIIFLAGASGMADCQLEIDLQADVNVTHIQGDAQSVTDFKDLVDTGYNPATHKVQGVVLTDTVTTYTGNTPQTGDAYSRLGAPAGASVSADIAAVKSDSAAILTDTAEIGAAGAGLTVLASAANLATVASYIDTEIGTILTHLAEIKGATFDTATDSLEALRNRGDSAWGTATGFSTHSAADVWAVGVRAITDKAGFSLAADQAVNVTKIGGSATPATQLALSAATIVNGAAATGTLSTTEMTTNLTINVADQYNGRVIIFAPDTTTAALRGQATDITATTVLNGKLGFTALTTAPVNGDTFVIV